MTKYYVLLSRGYMGDSINPFGTILAQNKADAKLNAKNKFEPTRKVLKILTKEQFTIWSDSCYPKVRNSSKIK